MVDMSTAMYELRTAIIADVSEDMGMIGEMTEWHSDLVEAWNNVCEASTTQGYPEPITSEDIEAAFDA